MRVPPVRGLIYPDGGDETVIGMLTGLLHIVSHDTPQPVVVNSEDTARGGNGHLPDENHGERFKEQGKTRTASGPGERHLMYSMGGAGYPGYPGGEVTLMLKEIEMAPALLRRVVHHRRLAAERTRESASPGKIEGEIQLLLHTIKVYSDHLPWPLKTQRLTK